MTRNRIQTIHFLGDKAGITCRNSSSVNLHNCQVTSEPEQVTCIHCLRKLRLESGSNRQIGSVAKVTLAARISEELHRKLNKKIEKMGCNKGDETKIVEAALNQYLDDVKIIGKYLKAPCKNQSGFS